MAETPSAGAIDDLDALVDRVLGALADPTRRRLLDQLSTRGQATASKLADGLPISRQAVIKHLAVLETAGLVESTKVGREVRYAVRPEALDTTARWMACLAADWDRRLAKITRVAEAAERAAPNPPARYWRRPG
jgi:DNA-binding transcriptional ArsR family regulator